ncbi:DNA adenine methylase [Desulfofundulus sp. TPOSR]|uniref:DNA adenine methylase n=1 Tax=Desulfofundulus sp. TPOSR TaxID=2714340 RepID=UPI0014086731|nr:DNA adenine methylase [Desulfofundulus sp. TPOSR]NHM26931.1 DNA adenine methylase [Desulfofundulus sp. TPOSR]
MPNNILTSPLRYPGSKSSLTDYIAAIIEENLLSGCTIYEPYAGSAVVSLEMLQRGYAQNAVLVERDPLVYAFWRAVFSCGEELCEKIKELEVTIETWDQFQRFRAIDDPAGHSILELGLAGLFYNRTNFSGIIGAGPIGGYSQSSNYRIDCRFNKARIIQQIRDLQHLKNRVSVIFSDALEFMKKYEEEIENGFSFVYIDPPYYTQGKRLYRYYYDDYDHQRLAEYILSKQFPWLLSYDDHPVIRKLYARAPLQPIYVDYSAKTSRRGNELLISNLVIPPLSLDSPKCEIEAC